MYNDQFDTYLPTHKRVGKSDLSGKCDNCGLEVTLDISENSFKFVDQFTNSELCFKKDVLEEMASMARKWRSIVIGFDSGDTNERLADTATPEKVAEIESKCRYLDDLHLESLYAYIDLYSQTPKFDGNVVEKILSPISLI